MLRLCAAFGAAYKEGAVGHTIYLADDEKSIRELLHSFLTSDGYEVRSFESGDALLAAFQQEPAELVILDIMMPGTDGLTVCRELLCFRHSHHSAHGKGQRAGLCHGHQPGR